MQRAGPVEGIMGHLMLIPLSCQLKLKMLLRSGVLRKIINYARYQSQDAVSNSLLPILKPLEITPVTL